MIPDNVQSFRKLKEHLCIHEMDFDDYSVRVVYEFFSRMGEARSITNLKELARLIGTSGKALKLINDLRETFNIGDPAPPVPAPPVPAPPVPAPPAPVGDRFGYQVELLRDSIVQEQRPAPAPVSEPEPAPRPAPGSEPGRERPEPRPEPFPGEDELKKQLRIFRIKERQARREADAATATDVVKDVAAAANLLYETIEKLSEEFFALRTPESELKFKQKCAEAINKDRQILEQFGWKEILRNLAMAILGVGVIYAVACLINKAVTGNFLFFRNDLAKNVDRLEARINKVGAPTAAA